MTESIFISPTRAEGFQFTIEYLGHPAKPTQTTGWRSALSWDRIRSPSKWKNTEGTNTSVATVAMWRRFVEKPGEQLAESAEYKRFALISGAGSGLLFAGL